MMLPVVVLAGGLATRLAGLSSRIPKALVRIAGRPFAYHQLDLLRRQGAERVVFCLGHFAEQIVAAVGDGTAFGLKVEYSFDGGQPLGTGGAVLRALPGLGDEFIVLNGDSYLPFVSLGSLTSAYLEARCPALMAIVRNENRWDRSNVSLRDGEIVEYIKRTDRIDLSYIDCGVSVLSRRMFSPYSKAKGLDLSDIFRNLSLTGQLAAMQMPQRFFEVGSVQGIADLENFIRSQESIS
jgi:MurNAc alpha-1-phosphate uridylyltransferase